MQNSKPLIRFGPASVIAILLLFFGFLSNNFGVYQTSTAWNGYLEQLVKSCVVAILLESMVDSVQRGWAVCMTIFFAVLWWIKAGVRLATSGASYMGDRVLGPAVSMVINPNGFATMLTVCLGFYLYLFEQTKSKWFKPIVLLLIMMGLYSIMETGSRSGMLTLLTFAGLVAVRYSRRHFIALIAIGVSTYFLLGIVSPANLERFKTIPKSIASALSGEEKSLEEAAQDADEHSATERTLKNKDTWALINEHFLFGVGISPDEGKYAARFPYATGQVHCEILMAGKQMGLIGMSLYVSTLLSIFVCGWKIMTKFKGVWNEVSVMGWVFAIMALTMAVAGIFNPLPWNSITFILMGTVSGLWLSVKDQYGESV